MTLLDASESMRLACIAQCYDDWHGYYVLRRLVAGQCHDRKFNVQIY